MPGKAANSHIFRPALVLMVMAGLAAAAIVAVSRLQDRATDYREALRLADERMYSHKRGLAPLGETGTSVA